MKRLLRALPILPVLLGVLLYAGGYIAQFAGNYSAWQKAGGVPGDGTSPLPPSAAPLDCIRAVFTPPYGIIGIAICLGLFVLLFVLVMKLGFGDKGEYDRDRNLIYSNKGTYGTAGFMTEREMIGILDLVPDVRKNSGTILGRIDKNVVCVPEKSDLNRNLAVYGSSGSKKTRAFAVNMVLQCVKRGESLIITDPKSEMYEKTSAYAREMGCVVKVFNLVSLENSDSWNCLSEIEGQELTAQLFCDVVIKNTGSERGDHFWDSSELNLLKALALYVEQGYPPESKNIGEVYKLLTMNSEQQLNSLFDILPYEHPAKAPYSIFKQASETVRSGIIIGLGSRLQVFQNRLIRQITSRDEIDLELPGKKQCVYYCITSDQDSTFDFLSSLFISFLFIKLTRYADKYCPDGRLPVPVHILGEELPNVGVVPDLSRKISVIRSRNISMSCLFQNLAGMQNRYPYNQWQEILGNCDTQLFLGCTDELTATFISDRTGEASVHVSSKAKMLGTWRISDYTPEYRETSGVGKRKLLTMDEVLRLPTDKALVILRGQKVLQVDKYDYSNHPDAKKLRPAKASEYVPAWQKLTVSPEPAAYSPPERKPAKPPAKPPAARPKKKTGPPVPSPPAEKPIAVQKDTEKPAIVQSDKDSIMS
ncbi:MAG: type IV secretory system conjugative DNA transfer family protein [Oscillospiraceae bacterium]|jgi:type IV secretion system protein VirD4|nr:type IV secretory system conjugative DNA transfer family protein [Oscillospiraceae bacterium]